MRSDRRAAPHSLPLSAKAEQAGWSLDRALTMFLDDVDACVDMPASTPCVAFLSDEDDSPIHALLTDTADVHVFEAANPDRHIALTAEAPFDVIVDDTNGSDSDRADLFRTAFLHLRRGGAYLIRDADTDDTSDDTGLAALLGSLTQERLKPPIDNKPRGAEADRRRLAAAIGELTIRGRHVLVTSRVTARAKLRDEQTGEFLRRRGPTAGDTVSTRPGVDFASRATVRESGSGGGRPLPTGYDAPKMSLRTYRNVTCAPGQVAWQGNVILPDTFRHNQRPSLNNRHLRRLTPLFAATPKAASVEHLAGAYFYLDSEFRGHFGHAITEQLSRLWAWRTAKAAEPDLKALLLVKNRELAQWELDLYAAAGVPADDVVVRRDDVTVERLYAATPMFSQPDYVHLEIERVWRQVSDRLAVHAEDRERPRKFFCARRGTKRPCRNAEDVEDLFAAHGFDVVHPEDYPLAEQAAMFRHADVIGGYAGSALFNTCLSVNPKHVVMVSSESYHAQNEYMVASVLKHRLDIAWCEADLKPTGRGFNKAVFHSPFTFNMDREGAWLQGILSSLP
ncbi:MAG TPA: glycosyltransferase 61 family protein [Nocardioidaceae bacterium]|nr:glycosyltransferase 61 family protein [Nocardioidaceae bacterium]